MSDMNEDMLHLGMSLGEGKLGWESWKTNRPTVESLVQMMERLKGKENETPNILVALAVFKRLLAVQTEDEWGRVLSFIHKQMAEHVLKPLATFEVN